MFTSKNGKTPEIPPKKPLKTPENLESTVLHCAEAYAHEAKIGKTGGFQGVFLWFFIGFRGGSMRNPEKYLKPPRKLPQYPPKTWIFMGVLSRETPVFFSGFHQVFGVLHR